MALATGVKLQKWLTSDMANTTKYVRFEAVVQDGVTAEAIDDSTMCDIIIIKVIGDRIN